MQGKTCFLFLQLNKLFNKEQNPAQTSPLGDRIDSEFNVYKLKFGGSVEKWD